MSSRTKKSQRGAEHVVINSAGFPGQLMCIHCGSLYDMHLPQPIDVMLAMSNTFAKQHRECKLRPEGRFCAYCNHQGHTGPEGCPSVKSAKSIEDWLWGPDQGTSSRTIVSVLAKGRGGIHIEGGPSIPLDPSDFGRCYRMLKIAPADWRARLGEVADAHPSWRPLVDHWDELTRLWEEESPTGKCPKLWVLMKKLTAPEKRP